MSKVLVLLAMIFCHIVDDYYLQAVGPLASMKQRKWWEENYPQRMYRYDYLVALLMHSMSWSFMIMLPIAFYLSWNVGSEFAMAFIMNTVLHAVVDNSKANWMAINLMQDQLAHMLQIAETFWIMLYVYQP